MKTETIAGVISMGTTSLCRSFTYTKCPLGKGKSLRESIVLIDTKPLPVFFNFNFFLND
jgi:hypothetical protein